MAKDYNNVKCEGCIHLGQFGNCWQGETPAECKSKMNIEQAIARLNDAPQRTTDAAGKYVDNALMRADPEFAAQGYSRHEKMRAAMFDGNDLRDAFEAGAAWAAQFGANAGK